MDPVTIIVGALAAGAAAGLTGTAAQAVIVVRGTGAATGVSMEKVKASGDIDISGGNVESRPGPKT